MCGGIDDKISYLNWSVGYALGRAAQVGADSGQQFLTIEGLGYLVVGAGIQCFDL